MALTDNLIAAWELNEASGTRVDSHGAFDLTDNNTVGSATGLVHALAADFEFGNSEYLSRVDHADLSWGSSPGSVEAWAKLESISGTQYVVAKGDGTGTNGEFYVAHIDTIGWTGSVFGGGAQGIRFVGSNASLGVWYQLIVTQDPVADQMALIVNNGTPLTASHTTGINDSAFAVNVGAQNSASFFDGLIGPVRFWKKVLSAAEITELYNAGAGLAYSAFGGGATRLPRPVHVRQAPSRASTY